MAACILLRKQGGQAAGTGSYEIAYATRIICFANKEDKSSPRREGLGFCFAKQGGLYVRRMSFGNCRHDAAAAPLADGVTDAL